MHGKIPYAELEDMQPTEFTLEAFEKHSILGEKQQPDPLKEALQKGIGAFFPVVALTLFFMNYTRIVSLFTAPDLTSSLDITMLSVSVTFVLVSLTANRLSLPLLNSSGGLFTYSKFASNANEGLNSVKIGGSAGMFLAYLPAGLVGAYLFPWTLVDTYVEDPTKLLDHRGALAAVLMICHFMKRCLESLFLHKYSGGMPLATVINIAATYSIVSFGVCHYSTVSAPFSADVEYACARDLGLALFAIGTLGNFYHHYLLANLRKPGEKVYKVPSGAFFEFVAAPHYLFELVAWAGAALVVQHVVVVSFVVFMTFYLTDRAVMQSEWNRTKLKDEYPASRKHIIPFVF